jgi:hypothetical protein
VNCCDGRRVGGGHITLEKITTNSNKSYTHTISIRDRTQEEMCGIAALFRAFVATGGADIWECVLRDLSRRGPDSLQQICVGKNVNLAAGVLHIQVNCSKILLFGR